MKKQKKALRAPCKNHRYRHRTTAAHLHGTHSPVPAGGVKQAILGVRLLPAVQLARPVVGGGEQLPG